MKLFTILFLVTGLAYSFSVALYLAYFIRRVRVALNLGQRLLWFGFIVHTLSIVNLALVLARVPIASVGEGLFSSSWLMVLIFLAFLFKYRVAQLGVLVAPVALIFWALASATLKPGEPLAPELRSFWLWIHATLGFVSYAMFTIAFVSGIVYLLQERQLKRKGPGVLYRFLPALNDLDRINYTAIVMGFPFLSLGILSGSLWAKSAWGFYWSWDPKVILAVATWCVYAMLFSLRFFYTLRGRRAALLSILGFCFILFTFLGVRYLLPSLHSHF